MDGIAVISIRRQPGRTEEVLKYTQSKWPDTRPELYADCLRHALTAPGPLPQWYGLEERGRLIGCAGLVTNDFVSRMDLWPWLCALHVSEERRGRGLGRLLIDRAARDSLEAGFSHLYLWTTHVGFYEKYGFVHLGAGHHPWGETSRIYGRSLTAEY